MMITIWWLLYDDYYMMITIWWLLYDDCYVMITILWYHLSTRQISKKQADRWDIHRRSLPLMFQECTAESACRSPGGTAPFWWGSNTSGRGCPGVWQNCGIRGIYIYYYILYIYYYMIYIYHISILYIHILLYDIMKRAYEKGPGLRKE